MQKKQLFLSITQGNNRITHYFALFFMLLAITSCSLTRQQPDINKQQQSAQWLAHQTALTQVTDFEVRGKIAFRGEEQRISANFVWRQQGDNLSLRLTHFLGSTLFKLDVTEAGAVIIDDQGKQHQGEDTAELITRLTGVALPIDSLSDWIKGLPTPQNSYQINTAHYLASLSEFSAPNQARGWQLSYTSYLPYGKLSLPEKIAMTHQTQQVNVHIQRWQIYR